mmetsp:Transcript_2865/g.4323  ORF Transcript_2865/g.4323 Transcript_2865/m.4323 type:complete len:87 (+) Transcript_2865:89-349(+)
MWKNVHNYCTTSPEALIFSRQYSSAILYGLKSITETTLEEKQAATRLSSTFQATSNMSPLPLKLLTWTPSNTFQMYNCPAKEPLAR